MVKGVRGIGGRAMGRGLGVGRGLGRGLRETR